MHAVHVFTDLYRHRSRGSPIQDLAPGGGGGGALRYRMATHCQTAQSRSGECQNIGAVNCFEGKIRGAVNFKLSTLQG